MLRKFLNNYKIGSKLSEEEINMLSLSQTIKDFRERIQNLEVNGGGSGSGSGSLSGAADIQVGKVSYGDTMNVSARKGQNGTVYLDFVLANPVTDARQFGVVVAASTLHHVIDRVELPSVATNELNLTEKPNTCPVILNINGFSYVENSDVFSVDRSNKRLTWNQSEAGFGLNKDLANEVFVSYEVSKTVTRINEKINIGSISSNKIALTNVPNETKVAIVINGVNYFEEQGDFSVDRSNKRITWNSTSTGFDIDSTLSGYITVSYEIDV